MTCPKSRQRQNLADITTDVTYGETVSRKAIMLEEDARRLLWTVFRHRTSRSVAFVTCPLRGADRDRILEPADWPAWLGEVEGDPAALLHPALLRI